MKDIKLKEEILKELFEKRSIAENKPNLYRQNESTEKFEHIVKKEETFEVIVDRDEYWLSLDTLKTVCSEISFELLVQFSFDEYKLIFNEQHVKVNKEFVIFIKNNTYNPKYIPILILITKEKNNDELSLESSVLESNFENETTSMVK